MKLHVWGPAFGLPSIDAECLAAIAYFQRIIPQGHWTLVANYDTSISPCGEFPLLVDGETRVARFPSIVSYLRNHHSGAYDLDYNLTHQQQTERTAFLSFLESTAAPLLDVYLYVASENYNSVTSSAYTSFLPWYANYTIPPLRRDVARARTAHLGLSSLDLSIHDDDLRQKSATVSSEYEAAKQAAEQGIRREPRTLKIGRGKGIGGLLSAPIYAARFKLDARSNELLQPLSELLGKKDYLLEGDKPTSLDCLCFGYLALMFYSPVPQAWLKETIQTKHPRIARYIGRLRNELIGGRNGNEHRIQHTFTSHLKLAVREIGNNISLFSRGLPDIQTDSHFYPRHSKLPSTLFTNSLLGMTGAFATVLAGFAMYHRRNPREGDLIFWALRPTTGFGEAGNILSIFANHPAIYR